MQDRRRAPLLSATSRMVRIPIIGRFAPSYQLSAISYQLTQFGRG
jgi:hypothetical protein